MYNPKVLFSTNEVSRAPHRSYPFPYLGKDVFISLFIKVIKILKTKTYFAQNLHRHNSFLGMRLMEQFHQSPFRAAEMLATLSKESISRVCTCITVRSLDLR